MADTTNSHDFEEHKSTYDGFIKGAIALTLINLYILIALCSVGFAATLPRFMAFAGIIIGAICILIDMRAGNKKWSLSVGFLLVYGLITAINVS